MASEAPPTRASWATPLRLVALVGTGAVLLQQAVSGWPLQPRQEAGFVVLILAVLAVALTFRLFLPTAQAQIRRHPDLLVPLGLLVLAEAALGWLLLLPPVAAVLAPSWPLQLWALTFSVSAGFVLTLLLRIGYATWMTVLVLEVVPLERADLGGTFSSVRRWFWRVLGLEALGWGVLFLGLAGAIAVAAAAVPLALVLMGVGSLLWNLMTAALLPVALDDRLPFWTAFRQGVRVSWVGKARWWKPVVVQMLLLGWVTYLSVSYTEAKPGSVTTHNKSNWSVNAFWTGGYEDESRWYGKLLEVLDAPPLAVISTALGLVFGVLALGVKLAIVAQLQPARPQSPGPSTELLHPDVPLETPPGSSGEDQVGITEAQ
jgi:hypothetical protein